MNPGTTPIRHLNAVATLLSRLGRLNISNRNILSDRHRASRVRRLRHALQAFCSPLCNQCAHLFSFTNDVCRAGHGIIVYGSTTGVWLHRTRVPK